MYPTDSFFYISLLAMWQSKSLNGRSPSLIILLGHMVAHPDLLLLFFGTKSWVSLVYFLQLVPRGQHRATAVVCSEGRIEEPLYQRHTPNCSPTGRRWRQVQMRRLESCHARGSYAGDQRHAECQLWVVGFRSCTPRNRVNSYRFRTWFLSYYILNL